MDKVIEVKSLYKLYRVGDEVVRALDGVGFEIFQGEFVGTLFRQNYDEDFYIADFIEQTLA